MQVQALFFDMDDTLLNDASSFRLAATKVCAEIHAGIDAARLASTYAEVAESFWSKQPWVTGAFKSVRVQLWRSALSACGCDDESLAVEASRLYAAYRLEIYELYADTQHLLEALAGRHRLAVITNGDGATQRNRLRLSGLDRYFDLVVAATDLDSGKPDPAIFRHALTGLGLKADDVWHIGDRLDSDVLGALNTGLTAVWLNRGGVVRDPDHPAPHHEIASLAELPKLVSS
jgi:HAD superfamily hydrolase (TIGR01549 family)